MITNDTANLDMIHQACLEMAKRPKNELTREKKMERGDHLVSPRTGYEHHGIYVGNGKVIHYGGLADGYSKEWIGETSLAGFAAGNEIFVLIHSDRVYDHDETVERAYSRLNEDEYNLVFNNCEHFANWCICGRGYSDQVNDSVEVIARAAKHAVGPISEHPLPDVLIGTPGNPAKKDVGHLTPSSKNTSPGGTLLDRVLAGPIPRDLTTFSLAGALWDWFFD